jgi:Na+/proline symporter
MPEPMFEGWFLITVALGYVGALFAVAWAGDRAIGLRQGSSGRPLIYALSVTVYCTSWTFFGSVGLAAKTGFDFIPVYLGPIIMFALLWPLLLRIVRLAKSQNLTSVADFVAARYGKSQPVAAAVTMVMIVGSLPYIALQLKAISVSIETLLGGGPLVPIELPSIAFADTAMVITLALAAFAILFGTRHIDATEHQDGLILAIALESVIKLAALTAGGLFIVFVMMKGPADFWTRAAADPEVVKIFTGSLSGGKWLTVTLLSLCCVILLPRQFHVIVVENNSEREIHRARWLFPLYLVAINLFVIPIAAAGLMLFQRGIADPDFFVLALPMKAGSEVMSLIAFAGGLSAATAMVIVEAVALSIMVSNGLVLPVALRQRFMIGSARNTGDVTGVLLFVRRISILAILLMAYGVYRALAHSESLVSIGLISFAAIAQVAPAFFGGLVWRNATARGALAGTLAGFSVWIYTLLLPWIARAGYLPVSFVRDGPLGIGAFRPEELLFLQFDPLSHGVFWSLGANVLTFIAVSHLADDERSRAHDGPLPRG